ncbi:hypothetical protein [Candidatus Pantoea persica]|nr:hypothetical protein [Candidatus Pantoea persica]
MQQAKQASWLETVRILPLRSLQQQQEDAALLHDAASHIIARL